jgi:two-component system, NtrC family, sensor kinase
VEIEVSDNGCGITKENIGKLFTPFFTTKESTKGTGLGLAICYGIVKMHSGNIAVDSAVGKGTTFTITLPVGGGGKS